jgi:hypothetical protein
MKKIYVYVIIIISAFVTGKFCGDYMRYSIIRGNISVLSYAFLPSQGFIDMYSFLNSGDDFKRLAGYYTYRDSGMADLDFLIERYKVEDSDIIKKVIIWAAEESRHKEKLVDFYKKIYDISPEGIQKILRLKIEENKK